jgi:hypothetical protein
MTTGNLNVLASVIMIYMKQLWPGWQVDPRVPARVAAVNCAQSIYHDVFHSFVRVEIGAKNLHLPLMSEQ